jgi:hypothetical protein
MPLCLKYASIHVIVVFLTLFLLFSGRSFPQLTLIYIGRNLKKIAKFLMRTFTYRSTFLYGYFPHFRKTRKENAAKMVTVKTTESHFSRQTK